MDTLIQTQKCSIIYGTFNGKENQELFRCPRELDDADLNRYINENRSLVGFESDSTPDLRKVDGKELIGYYRMYFRNGWDGRWMLENKKGPSRYEANGVQKIVDWICENFDHGCDYYMKDYMADRYEKWGGENRYLIRPTRSLYYKVAIDTTYGNGDYPVRIYAYRDKEEDHVQ